MGEVPILQETMLFKGYNFDEKINAVIQKETNTFQYVNWIICIFV